MPACKFRRYVALALSGAALIAVGLFLGCSGSNNTTNAPTGTVNTSLSDPPTCGSRFDKVYVTITKVTANVSADAGPNDSGWVTFLDLTSNPKQIDLLSLVSTTCVLTQLGSTSGLRPGNYQQIRLYLLDNSPSSGTPTPSSNACGAAGFNCVLPHGGSPQTLQLSSEVQTGIKIPSSQITSGGLTVSKGQSADLNIDFDSCASVVQEGNGTYRLKPVLHAGEISVNNNSISGKVVDKSGNAIAGALVLLEQPDSSKIDRVQVSGTSASDGTFIFCPLANPSGTTTYDVVVAARTSVVFAATTYNPTIAFNVPVGTNLNNITLVPEATGSLPGTISGQLTSAGSGGAAVADVTLSVLLPLAGGAANQVTIPVFGANSQPPVVATEATPSSGPACPSGTDCFNYSLLVSTSNPQVGTFANGAISYSAAPGTLTYTLEGVASDCTAITPSGGDISAIPQTGEQVSTTLAFTGCTSP
jgi:hypothetical protein